MTSLLPPIGIRSIEITDFRRIDHLRLEFTSASAGPSDIVVIGGPNGCGKTTVLEACLIAVGFKGELQGAKDVNATRLGGGGWEIRAEIQTGHGLYQNTTSAHRSSWMNITNGTPSLPIDVPCLYFSSWRAPTLVGALSIMAGRKGKRAKENEQNRIWRAKQHLIDSRAHELMAGGGSRSYDEDRRRLNEVWAMFHPRAEGEFVVEPVGEDPGAGFDVFLTSKDGHKVPVDALSSGQLELFALFGALMLVKFRDGIFVIDEPELHLDPQWHALMVRAIRRFLPTAQLLIATHSPKVYDSVMSFQRHFLVPDSDPRAQAWKTQPAGAGK